MRVDHCTSIHDLTDAEAVDLRALCEAMMRGPTPMDHPLFAAWSKASGLDDRQSLLAFTTAFLPRALHALLRRADNRVLDEAQAALYAADRAKAAAQKRYDKATSEWRKALAAASGGHA